MKFRLAAAITLYFLLALLFSTLSISSSREKDINSQIVSSAQSNLLQTYGHNILSLVINEFLTCKDILVLRQARYDFQYLLYPNDVHMVTFCVYGPSKTMTNVNIIWEDLKYFMKQSYYSAFYEMKMFNIKENEYAVLTRVPEDKYIVWNNQSIPYDQMLLDETTQYTSLENYYVKHFEQMKIFNKDGNAWAIITKERNVLTGGNKEDGGDSRSVQSQLVNVKMIGSTNSAFAALLNDGTVVTWGYEHYGGKIPDKIQTQLVNVKMIFCTSWAFAALLNDGTVVAWGNRNCGGTIPDEIQNKLINVKTIFSNVSAFVALLDNGTVVAWGNRNCGGTIPDEIKIQLVNIEVIFSTDHAFAALLNDGTVVGWGYENCGGKIPDEIQTQLISVKQIIPKQRKFTALCKDGAIFTWGQD